MSPLVIEPNVPAGVVDSLRPRRPDLPIERPDTQEDVLGALEGVSPVAFLCQNSRWDDRYLAGLAADAWRRHDSMLETGRGRR